MPIEQSTNEMTFFVVPPTEPQFIFGTESTIYADGPIDDQASVRLEKLIAERHIHENSNIYLNSPGGSLRGGMNLGRAIRKARLFAYIGQRDQRREVEPSRHHASRPGGCYSAATLAFLGGTYRWIGDGCVYGVHRFYAAKHLGDDLAQITSAEIIEYLQEMGVDPALFTEMTKAGRLEINELTQDRLTTLNVINGPFCKPTWTVESDGEALYLKGERRTWRGLNSFMLHGGKDRVVLHVVFDPEGRGDETINMGAHSLMIDGEAHPIEPATRPELVAGLVSAQFNLNNQLVERIKTAKTVGVAFQFFHGHPLFLGFDWLETTEGQPKIRAFLGSAL